ncbi:MAG: transporter substrate-binding domain-containing protein [Oligoflexia bacterium]|nr:transporter substrate-binding domain-containing protein [Oligoflexia bacterium]
MKGKNALMEFVLTTTILISISFMRFLSCSYAGEIKITFGLALPPYVISESNSGLEYDIIKESLAVKGHIMKPEYVPLARIPIVLKKRTSDGAATTNPSLDLKGIFFSEAHVVYQNVAISLKKHNLVVNRTADLSNKNVIAFQNATMYLGQEFAEVIKKASSYQEIADQEKQVLSLFSDRNIVVISDINIFKFYKIKVAKNNPKIDTNIETTIAEIFPQTHYQVAFINEKIRDDFNFGLDVIKKNGRYQEIVKKYIEAH